MENKMKDLTMDFTNEHELIMEYKDLIMIPRIN